MSWRWTLVLIGVVMMGGCGHAKSVEDPVVRAARGQLGKAGDDGAFLTGVLARSDEGLRPATGETDAGWLQALARLDGKVIEEPRAGAVIFFAQTVRAFHAGVVEKVEEGRITFVHATRGRVRRGVCDLARPGLRRDGRGRVVNSYLVPRRRDDLPGTRYLCGQLVAGFARF